MQAITHPAAAPSLPVKPEPEQPLAEPHEFVHLGRKARGARLVRLPFRATRGWAGALWDDECDIRAFNWPHESAEEALDWTMERCPED